MEPDILRIAAPPTHPPLSLAVAHGGVLHVSGCGPVRADGTVPEGFAAQFALVLEHLDHALAAGGSRRSRVLKTTVWLTRAADLAEMNRLYAASFPPGARPARTTAVVTALPVASFLLEIEPAGDRGGGGHRPAGARAPCRRGFVARLIARSFTPRALTPRGCARHRR